MSVKRRELINYLVANGFYLLREGKKHSIYTNAMKTVPIKRHASLDRITANELCKQAGLKPKLQGLLAGLLKNLRISSVVRRADDIRRIPGAGEYLGRFLSNSWERKEFVMALNLDPSLWEALNNLAALDEREGNFRKIGVGRSRPTEVG